MRSMSLPGKSRVSAGDIRKVTDNMKFSLNRINAIDAALDYAGIKTSNGNRDITSVLCITIRCGNT